MIIVTDASWEGQKNGPCPYFNLKESLWKAPREGESTGGMWCKQHGRPLVYSPASGALGSRFSVLYDAGFPAPPPVLALRSWFSVLSDACSPHPSPYCPSPYFPAPLPKYWGGSCWSLDFSVEVFVRMSPGWGFGGASSSGAQHSVFLLASCHGRNLEFNSERFLSTETPTGSY